MDTQKPDHCGCGACEDGTTHLSDCAVHNEPAYPNGPCDCGAAPSRTPAVLVNIGETIPDLPDIRLGTFIDEGECISMGEFDCPDGGYLIWNTDDDWFVIPKAEIRSIAPVPPALLALPSP